MTFDQDRSRVRTGAVPQVLAALRNTAIGLLRLAGLPASAAGAAGAVWGPLPWSGVPLTIGEPVPALAVAPGAESFPEAATAPGRGPPGAPTDSRPS
jgi:hypothetical protein